MVGASSKNVSVVSVGSSEDSVGVSFDGGADSLSVVVVGVGASLVAGAALVSWSLPVGVWGVLLKWTMVTIRHWQCLQVESVFENGAFLPEGSPVFFVRWNLGLYDVKPFHPVWATGLRSDQSHSRRQHSTKPKLTPLIQVSVASNPLGAGHGS